MTMLVLEHWVRDFAGSGSWGLFEPGCDGECGDLHLGSFSNWLGPDV